MGKCYIVVSALGYLLGGYFYGFIYAPQRWDFVPKGDLGVIAMGSLMGYLLGMACSLIYDIWKSTRGY